MAVEESSRGRAVPPRRPRGATVVLLHGGGWTVGSVADYDGLARRVAAGLAAVVLSVEYAARPTRSRPPSTTPWTPPAGPWTTPASGAVTPRAVAVAGDSGGGDLAAMAASSCATSAARPAAQLLLYANVARGADQPWHGVRGTCRS